MKYIVIFQTLVLFGCAPSSVVCKKNICDKISIVTKLGQCIYRDPGWPQSGYSVCSALTKAKIVVRDYSPLVVGQEVCIRRKTESTIHESGTCDK